jgi:uncharacterized protein YjbJ (UPF0337 family)
MLRAAGQGRKPTWSALGGTKDPRSSPIRTRPANWEKTPRWSVNGSVLGRPDRLLACDAPFICTTSPAASSTKNQIRCVCAPDRWAAAGARRGRLEHHYVRKRRETIVANESGPKAGVEGVAEDVKGRAKEALGAVTGNESVKQEGEAQQDKAAAQRDVAAKEAEAEKARAEASAAEAEQRSHQ